MATFFPVSPDSHAISTPRHAGHDRVPMEGSPRWESWSRRPGSMDMCARRPPHCRHTQRTYLASTVTTPNTSTPSLPSFEPLQSFAMERTLSENGFMADSLYEPPRSFPMERTPSGNSIIPDCTYEPVHNNTLPTYSDEEAAGWVDSHFRRLLPHGKYERRLRCLIDSREPIDNDALDSILTAADFVFFDGALKGRVRWEWSDSSQSRYRTELIGTTALRHAQRGGYETLIVLSSPILKDPKYDRRLLLSAFLHELIHCYLFICCGFHARMKGGHTYGFHVIAKIIDNWVGPGLLRLCSTKADLDYFRNDPAYCSRILDPRMENRARHTHDGCNQSPRPDREQQPEIVVIRSGGREANRYF